MGLENLKSAFQNITPIENQPTPDHSPLASAYQESSMVGQMEKTLGPIGNAVDFISSPILGFTLRMDNVADSQIHPNNIFITPTGMTDRLGEIPSWAGTAKSETNPAMPASAIKMGTGKYRLDEMFDDLSARDALFKGRQIVSGIMKFPFTESLMDATAAKTGVSFDSFTSKVAQFDVGMQVYDSIRQKTFGFDSVKNLLGVSDINFKDGNIMFERASQYRYTDTLWEHPIRISDGALSVPTDADAPAGVGAGAPNFANSYRGNVFQVLGQNTYQLPTDSRYTYLHTLTEKRADPESAAEAKSIYEHTGGVIWQAAVGSQNSQPIVDFAVKDEADFEQAARIRDKMVSGTTLDFSNQYTTRRYAQDIKRVNALYEIRTGRYSPSKGSQISFRTSNFTYLDPVLDAYMLDIGGVLGAVGKLGTAIMGGISSIVDFFQDPFDLSGKAFEQTSKLLTDVYTDGRTKLSKYYKDKLQNGNIKIGRIGANDLNALKPPNLPGISLKIELNERSKQDLEKLSKWVRGGLHRVADEIKGDLIAFGKTFQPKGGGQLVSGFGFPPRPKISIGKLFRKIQFGRFAPDNQFGPGRFTPMSFGEGLSSLGRDVAGAASAVAGVATKVATPFVNAGKAVVGYGGTLAGAFIGDIRNFPKLSLNLPFTARVDATGAEATFNTGISVDSLVKNFKSTVTRQARNKTEQEYKIELQSQPVGARAGIELRSFGNSPGFIARMDKILTNAEFKGPAGEIYSPLSNYPASDQQGGKLVFLKGGSSLEYSYGPGHLKYPRPPYDSSGTDPGPRRYGGTPSQEWQLEQWGANRGLAVDGEGKLIALKDGTTQKFITFEGDHPFKLGTWPDAESTERFRGKIMKGLWLENFERLSTERAASLSRVLRPDPLDYNESILTKSKMLFPKYSQIPSEPGHQQYYLKYKNSNAEAGSIDGSWMTNVFYPGFLEGKNDTHTVHPIDTRKGPNLESSETGFPFYFKDLRDNTYVVFRGYIDGLTENITSNWNEENYIGRSEPVYTYQHANRAISFVLKLFALSPAQLDSIYGKLDKLTSMCYPQYKEDTALRGKTRMKPPMTRFRLGELYGNDHTELLGFIDSVSYTFPITGPWEHRQGQRVPKYIEAAITYKVIHEEVPSMLSDFYGYPSTTRASWGKHQMGEVSNILDNIANFTGGSESSADLVSGLVDNTVADVAATIPGS